MFSLSDRLSAIVSLVIPGGVVADIGCDHALVAINLIDNHKADKVIACDVRKGPLERARENVDRAALSEKIELRLSDGLAAIKQNEVDTVIVAGMGGPLIIKIITEGMDKIGEGTKLILQPQSDIPAFRHFLIENGFRIEDEKMIFEAGKYYPMMRVSKGEADYSLESDFFYGKILIERKNEVLTDYLHKEREQLENILCLLQKNGISEENSKREKELIENLSVNKEARERLQTKEN